MNNNIMGKPNALKQVNLSLVRKAILKNGTATRAEIAKATKISATTIRTILTQMEKAGELVDIGFDDSIGGRKATRYQLNENRFFGVALFIDDENIRFITVNICKKICDKGMFAIGDNVNASICGFLDEIFAQKDIRSIGVGVPGIVSELGYYRKNADGELEYFDIGEVLRDRYKVPVVLENDLNAIVFGFGRCYLNTFPNEKCENVNMSYIHFEKNCLSAGFLCGGRILRGWNNFVGELGLFCIDGEKTLDQVLNSPLDDEEYAALVVKIIEALCCVLNPQFIALGGDAFRKNCLSSISEQFSGVFIPKMTAEILYAENKWHDYFEGMAYLTAEQIFAEVRLIKEQL